MGQAQINVRTRACSRTSIARTKQAALTHNVRGKELNVYVDKTQPRQFKFTFKVKVIVPSFIHHWGGRPELALFL